MATTDGRISLPAVPLPAGKRSWPRRIARWLAFTVAGLVALVALLLCFLQTPWGKAFVRARLEAKLGDAINGSVRVGSVDYSFLFRDIELGEIAIRDASDRPALAIGALRVTIDRGSLLAGTPVIDELAITGLDVATARLAGLAKPRPPSKPLASIGVEHLSIAGAITVEKPDGTTIAIKDLLVEGSLHARPAAKEVELALHDLAASATLTRPGEAPRVLALGIASLAVGKRADAVDVEVATVAAGALGIDKLAAHLKLDGKRLAGDQAITLAGLRVENNRLAALLGRELLRDDATIDVAITGPANKLVVDGDVKTGASHLALDGTVDLSDPALPAYDLVVAGTELRSDIVELKARKLPPVATSIRATLQGAGVARGTIDAKFALDVGATTVGDLAIDGLAIRASAQRGAFHLDRMHASAPGLELDATGAMGADRAIDGTLTVHGAPATIVATLAKYGIAVPPRTPLPPTLDLAVIARGHIDGTVAIAIQPTSIALAGGSVSLAGRASLEQKQLATADLDVGLHGLDLAAIARLAGRPPKVAGRLTGTLVLTKTLTDRTARYDVAIALPKLGLAVRARGTAQPSQLVARVEAARTRDKALVATLAADVPLTRRAGKPAVQVDRPLAVRVDVARRSLADLADLLPARLRGKLPAGDVELHVDLGGTAARPSGTIDALVHATAVKHETQRLAVHADISSTASGLAIATRGEAHLRDEPAPMATFAGTIATAAPFATGRLDAKALRAAATIDAAITLPRRDLAGLVTWLGRAQLAKLGGALDGRIGVTGPLAAPRIAAELHVRDLPTADGATHTVTIAAEGTPKLLTATVSHGDALRVVAAIDRATPGRIALDLRATAAKAPLRALVPAFLAPKLGAYDAGALDWAMTGQVALVRGERGLAVDTVALAGTLDLTGGAIALPNSTRRWHDIQLSVASEPTGLRITTLALHERDREIADRTIRGSGFIAWDRLKPQKVTLALAAHDWLLSSGSPTLGLHDAPRASVDFDLGVEVDLRAPVLAVDATVHALALKSPERFDRGHQFENASVSGDIIYTSGAVRAGKLPVTPAAVAAAPTHRRPIDIRVHIPQPIRVQQAPLDVLARGELTVKLRDEGVATRGTLALTGGHMMLMGHPYKLVSGSFAFTDEHPRGWLDVTFDYPLPPAVVRELSQASAAGGARLSLEGAPALPKKALGGANNAGLAEAMAINVTGHPAYVSAPGMPASETVTTNHGESLNILSFMSTNLPRLVFLDRITAYADPTHDRAAYGRIQNVEAERYARDQRSRVRAVVRPPTPGRSSAELQYDRLFINSDHTAIGAGVRAGDRAGGGVGLFLEWSSD